LKTPPPILPASVLAEDGHLVAVKGCDP